jgi:FlaA1/EpsC-like NDP-sugar epimerase
MRHFFLEPFIASITGRPESLFRMDIEQHKARLRQEIDGRSVLVIGGAGTIGGSFIRSILRYGAPASLTVVDINENGLTELTRDLRSGVGYHIPQDYITYPVNFGDPVFRKIFDQKGHFDIVANFAAHKHVRSEKDEFAIEAMIENNVLKAKGLLDRLLQSPPRHFFCVSTDKAANPVNIMGASKKLMEEVIMAYASRMKITTARFANVAFSNGSLPAGFLERLTKRQPLSSPADIRRFFVSPEESGEICMLACLLGESGDIFFPKLDAEKDMLTFTLIAEKLLAAYGYEPDYCSSEEEARQKALLLTEESTHYPVYFFQSDTSGEKPYEEFYTDKETLDLAQFDALGIIKNTPRKEMAEIDSLFIEFEKLFGYGHIDKREIVRLLNDYLPNFEHIETGKHLDQKM